MSDHDDMQVDRAVVPPEPVVRIVVDPLAAQVTINGTVVEHDGSASLHQVAVHAAARQVAQVLGRPVRAVAYVAGARSRMVIHPDGRATDVEVDVAAFPPVAGQTGPRQPPHASRRRHPSRRALVLAGALFLVLGGWGAGAVGLALTAPRAASTEAGPLEPRPAPTPQAAPAAAPPPSPPPTPSSPAPFRLAPSQELRPDRQVTVTATAGATSLVLRVTATHLPVKVRVVVRPPTSPAVVRTVRLRAGGRQAGDQRIQVRGLRPGVHRWAASAVDAERVRGTVVIAPPPPEPSPTEPPSREPQPAPAPAPSPAPGPGPQPGLPPGPVDPGPGPTGPVG